MVLNLGTGLAINGLSRQGGGAPVPFAIADQALAFGALTLEGAGGIKPVTSGTPAGAYQISGGQSANYNVDASGFITPASDGAATDGDSFTYGDGTTSATLTISTEADTYSFASASEIDTLLAFSSATLAGKTLMGRDGNYGSRSITSLQPGTPLSITSHNTKGVVFSKLTLAYCYNLTFTDIRVTRNTTGTSSPNTDWLVMLRGDSSSTVTGADGCKNVTFDDCEVYCTADDPTDYVVGFYSGGYKNSSDGGCIVRNCEIHRCFYGLALRCPGALITNNYVHDCYSTGITQNADHTGRGTEISFNHVVASLSDGVVDHLDCISIHAPRWVDELADPGPVYIKGNICHLNGSVASGQGLFVQENTLLTLGVDGISSGDSGFRFSGLEIDANVVVFNHQHVIAIQHTKDSFVRNNTAVRDTNLDDLFDATAEIKFRDKCSGMTITGNVCEEIVWYDTNESSPNAEDFSAQNASNNVELGYPGTGGVFPYTDLSAYSAAFDGSFPQLADTKVKVLSLYNMKANGTLDKDDSGDASVGDVGAVGSGVADFDAMTIDESYFATLSAATFAYSSRAFATTQNLVLPTVVAAGDLIVVVAFTSAVSSLTPPAGFTLVDSDTTVRGAYVYKKMADGTEGGTTVTFTTGSSCTAVFVGSIVSGATGNIEVEFASSLNPPSIAPSAGASFAFLAVTKAAFTSNSIDAPPSGYDGLQSYASYSGSISSSSYLRAGIAEKIATGSPEDPGAFTWSGATTDYLQSCTIAVW